MTSATSDGAMLAKGKTKAIYSMPENPDWVRVHSFDSLTAFNAKRTNVMEGKAAAANKTTCNVFKFLAAAGVPTHFICEEAQDEFMTGWQFIAQRCEMIPIEWVARRVATGSFLKRHPGVPEGYRFSPPKIETFYKDDAADDPQWSEEQILCRRFTFANGKRCVGRNEISAMRRWTSVVFQLLERQWQEHASCQLVDMKVEFGVNRQGEIVLADVVDNDSWRVWPGGDKRLQLDKQAYRDLPIVTDEALKELKKNYDKVAEITAKFTTVAAKESAQAAKCRLVIVMGSKADLEHAKRIQLEAAKFGIVATQLRICSAHKCTTELLELVGEYEGDTVPTVFITVAGRSNGLGGVLSANTHHPVINAPPLKGGEWGAEDVWSSLRMPSGIGATTVLSADEAALAAAKILAAHDNWVYSKLIVAQTKNVTGTMESDTNCNAPTVNGTN